MGKEVAAEQGIRVVGKVASKAKQAWNAFSDWIRNGEEVAQKARKLSPRNSANQKLNNMLSEASRTSEEETIAQQHADRVAARIRKNAGGNEGLENNLGLRVKYAEQKYGKDFENKLINDLDFSTEGARRYANEEKLRYVNKYLTDQGITPKNLTRAEAESINKAVIDRYKVQQQKKIQDIEKLAERYNRMHPTFSPKGAAYIAAGIGGAGLLGGTIYNALTSGTPNNSQEDEEESPEQGFIQGDAGNVVFRDSNNQLHDDFIQDSDGTVYNRAGQVIGNVADQDDMSSAGYNNVFDYNAAKALGTQVSPQQVAQIQQMIGTEADGKWGARTQAAYENAIGNFISQLDPASLASIYERKKQLGY